MYKLSTDTKSVRVRVCVCVHCACGRVLDIIVTVRLSARQNKNRMFSYLLLLIITRCDKSTHSFIALDLLCYRHMCVYCVRVCVCAVCVCFSLPHIQIKLCAIARSVAFKTEFFV